MSVHAPILPHPIVGNDKSGCRRCQIELKTTERGQGAADKIKVSEIRPLLRGRIKSRLRGRRRSAGRRHRGAVSFRGDDGLAAGTSDDPIGLAVFCDNRGRHAGQGPLSRRGQVGPAEASRLHLIVEIRQRIVQDHSTACGDQVGTEIPIQSVGDGNGIAVGRFTFLQ